jgi:[protein-PII] uridylyltransferase
LAPVVQQRTGSLSDAETPRARYAVQVERARAELVAEIGVGRGGHLAVSRYARRIDELIRDLVLPAQGRAVAPFAVCALGGYGRRALCLHSDIDLLIVFDGQIGLAEERLVKALLHPLWDLRFTVGHQVRELADLEDHDLGEPELLLGLLDARLLAGDARVFQAIRRHLPRPGRVSARSLLESLRALNDERHARYNDTFYQLEPDLKEAPGGLRDVAAIHWIRMLVGEARMQHGRFDEARLRGAEDFLLRIRSVLHLDGGRNTNTLTHALQERVADVLGFDGARPQQRVEALMGAYFRHARTVARMLEWSSGVARGQTLRTPPTPVGDNLAISADGLEFVDRTRAASDPASWLLVFRTAVERGCAVSDSTLSWIGRHIDRHGPEDFTATAPQRRLIRDLLRPRPGLYQRLSEMHDCGLLGRVFPEFERIHCRVIRDFYHKYTVDEHTLLTLRNLEALLHPASAGRGRFGALLQEIHAPDLLALALLFHDVGKSKDVDHTVESVRMAQTMFERLALPADARRTIEFLIRNHLEMSRLALRRDSEDPAVARQLASLAGTEEQLKMLCLMTLVDIDAVGPGTLTPWKEEQLWRVYVDAYNQLTLGYADDLIETDPAELLVLRAGRPADISEEELLQFVTGLPRRYLALFDYRHVRLARNIQPDDVHSFLEWKDGVWELTVVTVDRPGLFSNLCGLLSYYGMDILRGQAMTSPTGLVVDVFQFNDQENFLRHNSGAPSEIARRLQDVVSGAVDVTQLLAGKERSLIYQRGRRVAPVVRFDAEHSQKYTVLEIVADDALGLLYRISRVISGQGCDVDLVLISTEGRTAIDVFHVTRQGAKLSKAAEIELKRGLERMLEPEHEAD